MYNTNKKIVRRPSTTTSAINISDINQTQVSKRTHNIETFSVRTNIIRKVENTYTLNESVDRSKDF